MKQPTLRPVITLGLALCASAWLAGCANGPNAHGTAGGSAPGQAPNTGAAASAPFTPPQVHNTTPFPDLGLTNDDATEYVSLGLKITYQIDGQNRLRYLLEGQEKMIGTTHDAANDLRCTDIGGGFNQRTTFFPDTGIFTHGAALTGVRSARGQARPLQRLRAVEDGTMAVTGKPARDVEYAYMPCVGSTQVRAGVRTDGYLQPGDQLTLKPPGKNSKPVRLTLRPDVRPFVVLAYADGTSRAFVPARVVLMTVDWPRRRAVVQYQVTFPIAPQVAQAVWSGTVASGAASSPHLNAFNDAMRQYLDGCPAPTQPMDACGVPGRSMPQILRDEPLSQ